MKAWISVHFEVEYQEGDEAAVHEFAGSVFEQAESSAVSSCPRALHLETACYTTRNAAGLQIREPKKDKP